MTAASDQIVCAFNGEPRRHASLSGAEYRALLDANGFTVLAQTVEDPRCGGHTVWLAQRTMAA